MIIFFRFDFFFGELSLHFEFVSLLLQSGEQFRVLYAVPFSDAGRFSNSKLFFLKILMFLPVTCNKVN